MAAGILVFVAVLVAVNAIPIEVAQNSNQNFIPGVFISSETLKELQDKAKQNQNPPITNQGPITNSGRNVPVLNSNSQTDEPVKIGTAYQANAQNNQPSQPALATQTISQPAVQSQPAVMTQSPPQVVAQPLTSSQPASQPILVTQQSQPHAYLVQQQQQQQPIYFSQPANQLTSMSQPNQQFVLSNGQVASQPNQQIVLSNGQVASQPNQQIVLSNGQIAQIVSNGQPLVNAQPLVNGQTLVSGQPLVNAQPLVNGQTLVSTQPMVNGQSMLVSTSNPGNNQYTLIQGSRPNTVQNPNTGVQYAVVPLNQNNNAAPNTNLGSSNTYVMVPGSNQVYAVSG